MENAVGVIEENNDMIAIFFLQPSPPTCRPFTQEQRRTDANLLGLLRAFSGGLMGLPQAESSAQSHHQQGEMAMHNDSSLASFGKAPQMPGMLAFFENPVFNDRAPVIGI